MKHLSPGFVAVSWIFPRILLIAAASASADVPEPPGEWREWAAWVEKQHPVSDDQGHGPDIGGDEWARALDRRLGISGGEGHGPDIGSKEWRSAVVEKLAAKPEAAVETRELLSAHETEAVFEGLKDHRCRGRTSLCPDDCGHSGKLAEFTITKYLRHEKPGEFGDPEQKSYQVMVEDNHGTPKVPAAIRAVILTLKPGDFVRLAWNHEYVSRAGSKFPERPIVALATPCK